MATMNINPVQMTVDSIDVIQKWIQLKRNNDAKTRMLILEVKRNLDVLNSVNLEGENKISQDDKSLIYIINALDIEVLQLVFLDGEANTDLFKRIRKIQVENLKNETDEDNNDKINKPKTPIHIIAFIHTKIYAFKKLINLYNRDNSAFKNILFRTRLNNIKKAYIDLEKALWEQMNYRGKIAMWWDKVKNKLNKNRVSNENNT